MTALTDPFDILLAPLFGDDFVLLADAARLLGELGDARAVEPLCRAVTESRHYTKGVACLALGSIGDPAAVPALQQVVDEPAVYDDWFWIDCQAVRAAAAVALLALGDEGGAALLQEMAERGSDLLFSYYAPTVLRLPESTPAARQLKLRVTPQRIGELRERKLPMREPGRLVFQAEAFGLLGTPEAQATLRQWLGHTSRYVRGAAAVALLAADPSEKNVARVEHVADADATDFARLKASLAVALAGSAERAAFIATASAALEDPFNRAVAVEALGLIGDRRAHADIVASQSRHPDAYVRLCTIEALERLSADGGPGAARRLLDDADPRVVLQAARLLAALEGGKEGSR